MPRPHSLGLSNRLPAAVPSQHLQHAQLSMRVRGGAPARHKCSWSCVVCLPSLCWADQPAQHLQQAICELLGEQDTLGKRNALGEQTMLGEKDTHLQAWFIWVLPQQRQHARVCTNGRMCVQQCELSMCTDSWGRCTGWSAARVAAAAEAG